MAIPDLSPYLWALGIAAAVLVGVSKTGVPGAGILVVPLLARIFGARLSVGTMLPMLIFADCFAVAYYRRHAQWDKLWGLFPSVGVGVVAGAAMLHFLGKQPAQKDFLNVLIGALVLVMVAVHLLRQTFGERISLRSRVAMAAVGSLAGFSTTVSNAAGPVMGVYLTSLKLPKEQFMGTTAWYFFIVNVVKLPILIGLSIANPSNPIMSGASLAFDVMMVPVILFGVFLGKWMLPRISQRAFDSVVLCLAAVAAVNLIHPLAPTGQPRPTSIHAQLNR
jgi:uncharacterized membrane protein YfcA